ncbi:MAG: M13 family metallopeptidase [Verrucomicrobia bacterium]|nr:M13 family metallopeptidase [Verrucomicrobiota bacterium]
MKFAVLVSMFGSIAFSAQVWSADEPPIDPASMDLTTTPGVDFFQYANGGWLATHAIPPEYSRWGSFIELGERNLDELKSILEACSNQRVPDHIPGADNTDNDNNNDRQKLGLFYASGMDEGRINAEGAKPLQSRLDRIRDLPDPAGLAAMVGQLHLDGADPLFSFEASIDDKDSGMEIATLVQGGLGLPDRDYYLKTDDKTVRLRSAYRDHLIKMFGLLGDAEGVAAQEADQVIDLETKLAQASKSRVELRDPEDNYHRITYAELERLAPAFDWKTYFQTLGLTSEMVARIDVKQPEFCHAFSQLLAAVPLDTWKVYLRWNLIRATARYLSDAFAAETFEFYSKTLTGAKEPPPRWKRVVRAADAALGQLLGRQYVEKTFPPSAKERALRMVQDLKQELRERLQALTWMSPETKKAAAEKLDAMGTKIGYPDKWRDYSGLELKDQPYVLNALAAAEFDSRWELGRIGKPVDPTQWNMTPPTVNAYYSPTRNEIVFPAGILQPPFFYANADDAVNYGGIGAVIGHEMTHGFDDQGRLYDAKGNLRNWWTSEDSRRFKERAGKIIEQFDQYVPIDDAHINGKLTQGENIADLGGVKIAYGAFQKALERSKVAPEAKIDDFTVEQRFFLSYARVWRMKYRPEALLLALTTDPHSPPKYRVIGPLSNLPEFAQAFAVPADSPMVRPAEQRVNIW